MGRRRGAAQLHLPICTECGAEVPARPLGGGLLCRALMLLICNLQAPCFSVFLPPPSPPLPWLFFLSFRFFSLSSSVPPVCFSHSSLFAPLPPFFFLPSIHALAREREPGDGVHFIIQAMHIVRIIPRHWGRLYPFQVTRCYASSLFLISLRMPSLARSHGRSPSGSQEQFL